MGFTIDELMKRVNCAKFPDRWREIYDDAMADYEANGCALLEPKYYDRLHAQYGMLGEYLDVYKQAACLVRENEALSAFLALVCYVLRDREHCQMEMYELARPVSPDGGHDLAYDMVTGLAMCSQADACYARLKARKLPEDLIRRVMCSPEAGVREYAKRNGGAYGYHLAGWFQHSLNAKLFPIGRLEIEINSIFHAKAAVFRNGAGEEAVLAKDMPVHKDGFFLGSKYFEDEEGSWTATLTETEDSWIGYPVDERGYVLPQTVTLPKSEWKLALQTGDPVVHVHIPAAGSFAPEVIDETLRQAKAFLKDYYPDYEYKAICCHSWLMDPQLEELVGEDANIVRFGKRFRRICGQSAGQAVFYFVYLSPSGPMPVDSLPENTRLERAMKAHYQSGKVVYEMFGYFFPEREN